MTLAFFFDARDAGRPVPGLSPEWVAWRSLSTGALLPRPWPAIRELGEGQYAFDYDALAGGDATGQIDLGPTFDAAGDRYVDVRATREGAAILSAARVGVPWVVGG